MGRGIMLHAFHLHAEGFALDQIKQRLHRRIMAILKHQLARLLTVFPRELERLPKERRANDDGRGGGHIKLVFVIQVVAAASSAPG